jgi:hypothetical protein
MLVLAAGTLHDDYTLLVTLLAEGLGCPRVAPGAGKEHDKLPLLKVCMASWQAGWT